MSDNTAIEWSDATWNFLVGCSKVSAGCTNCYAIRSVARMSGNPTYGHRYQNLVTVGQKPLNWTGKLAFIPEMLTKPLGWKQPRRIFVNSLSDLFHPDVPDEWIDQAFAIMALTPRHTYQILTKRPERMAAYVADLYERNFDTVHGGFDRTLDEWGHGQGARDFVERYKAEWFPGQYGDEGRCELRPTWFVDLPKPLPNVWLGTSTEDQKTADERIPHLLATPAAVRFLSCEPLLSSIDLRKYLSGGSQDDNRRDGDSVHVCDRHAEHGRRGQDLETPRDLAGERDWRQGNSLRAETSGHGTVEEGRVPPRPGDGREGALRGSSQPHRVDGCESADDPSEHRGQSHRRSEGQQSPLQPGAFDQGGERSPLAAHAGQLPEAAGGEADTAAGSGDPRFARPQGHESCSGCRGVQREYGDRPEHREPIEVELASRSNSLIHWVITGGESGTGHRPIDPDWARGLRDQCAAAGVAFFFKQWSGFRPKSQGRLLDGREWNELPAAPLPAGATTP